jgi:hypothetical protein
VSYKIGQHVTVKFDGELHEGRIVHVGKEYVFAKIVVDPFCDYGDLSALLAPESVVYVREKDIQGP